MKDIGGREDGQSSSLSSLLSSLTLETGGYPLPAIPQRRPSSAPLTEEELLNLPFYSVATPQPEVKTFYRIS